MLRNCGRFLVLVPTTALVLAAQAALAADLVDVRWGFDGKVVKNRFNVLSLLLNNPTPEAFDGELVLHKRLGVGQPIDARLVHPLFIGPFGETRVWFYPYIDAMSESWSLEIRPVKGRSAPATELPQPRLGWPSRVLIESSQSPSRRTFPVKRLPDRLFPPFVTATDALQAVLIDSIPDWDEPRRQAFLDWLYRGGTVFVMEDTNGNHPSFPAALGVLNSPLELTTHGAGRVFHVSKSRYDLTPESLSELFAVLPKRLVQEPSGQVRELSPIDLESDQELPRNDHFSDGSDVLSANSFLSRLRSMTKPKHNWAVLHLLFWTYIGLVFPGCYLMGRKWADYRAVYVSLLVVVLVFSLLFAVVGQRGYGESTAVNSIAFARPLEDGSLDVSQWSNAFVTLGGNYDFRHNGAGVMYSTCNVMEEARGFIQNGAEGHFLADVPPFSSREFAHRIKVKAPIPAMQVEECEIVGGDLKNLTVRIDDSFPRNDELLEILYGNKFYKMNRGADRLHLITPAQGTATGFLRVQEYNNYNYPFNMYDQRERSVLEQYRDLFLPMIARSLNVGKAGDADALMLPPHIVRLFYFGPLPPEFTVQNKYLGRNDGWVLYAIDLPTKP